MEVKNSSSNIKVVEESNGKTFTDEVNLLLEDGYKILSTNCGFVNSEQYDFPALYQAILIKSVIL